MRLHGGVRLERVTPSFVRRTGYAPRFLCTGAYGYEQGSLFQTQSMRFPDDMKLNSGCVRLSATDLSNHLACHHLTSLDLDVTSGKRSAPSWRAPNLWILQQRGMQHEAAYLTHLQNTGLTILDLREFESEEQAVAATRSAMAEGVDVIAQATLADGRWFGRSDVLRRVEKPSTLGAWSYEVYDCKLALETKAGPILQLSLYSELLSSIQATSPEWMYVVTPAADFQPEVYRVLDFAAYYRQVKAGLEKFVERDEVDPTYPAPNPHCPVCRWWTECDAQWRKDDHLSLVAGITTLQQKQLHAWDTTTVNKLAELPLPLERCPDHGSKEGYVRVREQARVQIASRTIGQPVHELLQPLDNRGLSRLPEPSPGDVFFDLEGDPFARLGGQEYLFGLATEDKNGKLNYDCRWAITPEQEKQGFQWFIDLMVARASKYPAMHIYHFTSYEPSALKRLMGRYATREDEVDSMLRAGVFIDLHTILKQAVRASVEQYSLKALEIFHNFERSISLDESRQAMRRVEHSLELGRADNLDEVLKKALETYNADDCFSTRSLRNWLEDQRKSLDDMGQRLGRPVLVDGAPPESVNERQQRVAILVDELRVGVPIDFDERTEEEAGRWLMANLLDWHRREDKANWWEYFWLKDLPEDALVDESAALSGLSLVKRVSSRGKLPIDRYNFPEQESDVREGDKVCQAGDVIGEVIAIDMAECTVDIKRTRKTVDIHPTAVYADPRGPRTDTLADALFRLGTWVKENGLGGNRGYSAGRDLLLRRPPRTGDVNKMLLRSGESTIDAAKRIAVHLDHSILAIQGPPGTGKTYAGAEMICELIRHGKKVGVTAVSHKVIRNLLNRILIVAKGTGLADVSCMQKLSEESDENPPPGISFTTSNATALAAIQNGACHVLGGTAWLWSREDFFESVDVLFVDEAGQMALANVLAASQAARSVVLLGDPQQLEQPLRGSHPEGADVSALEHLLAEQRRCRRTRGCSWKKPGAYTRKYASSHPRRFTKGVCNPVKGWRGNGSKAIRGWERPVCGSFLSITRVIKTHRRRKWNGWLS